MITLPLFARIRDEEKAVQRLDRLLDILSDGRWYKGSELCQLLHTNERVVRRIADLSAGRILGSDKGYRMLRHATNDEIDHAENRLISQAKRMMERAAQYRKERNAGRQSGEAA